MQGRWRSRNPLKRTHKHTHNHTVISVVKRETTTKVAVGVHTSEGFAQKMFTIGLFGGIDSGLGTKAQTRGSRARLFSRVCSYSDSGSVRAGSGDKRTECSIEPEVYRRMSDIAENRNETKGNRKRSGGACIALLGKKTRSESLWRALSQSPALSSSLFSVVSDLRLTNVLDRLSTASEAYPTAGNFLTALTVFDDPEASFKVVQNAFLLGRCEKFRKFGF
ncbi:hypothetical protein DL96DRAFT_1566448 [Flagelloscypha sp. PMI_526]|nr:hypothetical protein DL96DRAFT_1566448 [Flagelloscypha sp. PMI_526]